MERENKKKILAMMPAFNEQGNIGPVIRKIRQASRETDVLVIDDGSRDKTAAVARVEGAKTISLSSHMGYGVALQTGYKYAFEQGYDYLVQLDADGQHDPAYITDFLSVVMSGEADVVVGSRFLGDRSAGGAQALSYRPGFARNMGIKLFACLTSLLVGFRVTDPTSGYQALNRKVIGFFIRDFFPYNYPDADIILMAHRAGFRIKELPIVILRRQHGKSMHGGMKSIFYPFALFLSMFMTLLRGKPPFLRNERAFREQLLASTGNGDPGPMETKDDPQRAIRKLG